MKNTFKFLFMSLLSISILSITSCKKDDHDHDHEEEITTLEITFTEKEEAVPLKTKEGKTLKTSVFKYKVIDGVVTPEYTGDLITVGLEYDYSIRILNEDGGVEDLTAEIEDGADDHLFCIEEIGSGDDIDVFSQDKDAQGKNFGLNGGIIFTVSKTYDMKITLKHNPNKNASNPCGTGDTDIEAVFQFIAYIPI